MIRARTAGLAASVLLLTTLAGCPAPPTTVTFITGSFSGTVTCDTTVTTLGLPAMVSEDRDVSVTFNDSGVPTAFGLLGGGVTADVEITVNQEGQTQTVTGTRTVAGQTQTSEYSVTVDEVTLGDETARIVISYTVTVDAGSTRLRSGSGTATFNLARTADGLTFSLDQSTDLVQNAGGATIALDVVTDCDGTLAAD